jgi:hypothetical protein
MRIKYALITTTLLVTLCAGVQAQTRVYQTTDADGNPVFSDEPSENAQSVDIPATNVVNAPPPMEPVATPAPAPDAALGAPAAALEEGPRIVLGDDDERRRRAAEGDGFVTKETPDGPIIVNEREQQRALKENEEYFVDHEGVRRIRPRRGGHRGR